MAEAVGHAAPLLAGKRVLIAEAIAGCSQRTFHLFRALGCELVVGPDVSQTGAGYTRAELEALVNSVDGIVGMSREKLPADLLQGSGRVQVLCKYGIGVDHIDVEAATQRGILVSNTLVHNNTVAEHAVTLMLAVLKKLPALERHTRALGWRGDDTLGRELCGKTVGIVGLGGIGCQVIRRLQGWEVELLGYDPYVDEAEARRRGAAKVSLEELLARSDIVSLHLPLTGETRHLLDAGAFSRMKPGAVVINTARGGIVDQAALVEALRSGHLGGAGLDVFEREPLRAGEDILSLPNVVITCHNAGWTGEALQRIADQAHHNCIDALCGRLPESLVNPAAVPAWRERFGWDRDQTSKPAEV